MLFWALPLRQPRFPVESRDFPALHAPFLKRKAHTWSCPELHTGNRGNRRVRLPRVKASVLHAVSAPILRVLCEGWDSQVSPLITHGSDLFLRKGFPAGTYCEEKPRSQNRDLGHPPRAVHEVCNKESRRDGTACSPARECRVSLAINRAFRRRSCATRCRPDRARTPASQSRSEARFLPGRDRKRLNLRPPQLLSREAGSAP